MVSPQPPLHPRNSEPRPVAIVTGSSQGLGLAIALRLADDGCDVVINDLPPKLGAMEDAVRRIVLKGVKALAVVADVSREDEVKSLIETTVEKFGKVDTVRETFFIRAVPQTDLSVDGGKCGRGGHEVTLTKLRKLNYLSTFTRLTRDPRSASVSDFDWLMNVNTRGVMLCFKYAAQQMVKQGGGGKIIGSFCPSLNTFRLLNFRWCFRTRLGACSMAGKRGRTGF
jgi:NAD(P)-dependent dehydrogenase (short-subunit alcohol dehydrogenase family)